MIVLIPNKSTNLTHLLGKMVATMYLCVIIPSNHSRKKDGDSMPSFCLTVLLVKVPK